MILKWRDTSPLKDKHPDDYVSRLIVRRTSSNDNGMWMRTMVSRKIYERVIFLIHENLAAGMFRALYGD